MMPIRYTPPRYQHNDLELLWCIALAMASELGWILVFVLLTTLVCVCGGQG